MSLESAFSVAWGNPAGPTEYGDEPRATSPEPRTAPRPANGTRRRLDESATEVTYQGLRACRRTPESVEGALLSFRQAQRPPPRWPLSLSKKHSRRFDKLNDRLRDDPW